MLFLSGTSRSSPRTFSPPWLPCYSYLKHSTNCQRWVHEYVFNSHWICYKMQRSFDTLKRTYFLEKSSLFRYLASIRLEWRNFIVTRLRVWWIWWINQVWSLTQSSFSFFKTTRIFEPSKATWLFFCTYRGYSTVRGLRWANGADFFEANWGLSLLRVEFFCQFLELFWPRPLLLFDNDLRVILNNHFLKISFFSAKPL